jgi:hypothetical protein
MRLPRWSDEPVDLIPVMIFLDIKKEDYGVNIRKKAGKANLTMHRDFISYS